jgi:hypothetical protein
MVKSTMFKSTISAAVLAAGMFFVSPAFAADAQFNVPLDCDDHDIIVMGILNTTTGVPSPTWLMTELLLSFLTTKS